MYYIRIDAENPNKLIYYCRNCGNEDKLLTTDNVCISSTQIKKGEQGFSHIINKYTKLDPTLPRVSKILCPNPECGTNKKDEKREIIYIRYDDTNMKYIYLCSTCDTIWKTEEQN
jgi:DNA-directed RNA polymerase subunit M/transcription elongation factor TFIIS